MNILVLNPGRRILGYAFFGQGGRHPLLEGTCNPSCGPQTDVRSLLTILRDLRQRCASTAGHHTTDVVAIRTLYGGSAFGKATLVTEQVVATLGAIAPEAPLHLPGLLVLIEACQEIFPNRPLVAAFETAFFVPLPPREHLYALAADTTGSSSLRRYGFHGLLHEAACAHVLRLTRASRPGTLPRTLSLCLEPRPELAAVAGGRPIMVTGGATPLEGIPGQTSCGQIDPAIVMALAQEKGWGPEQIDAVLTRQSGLLGLTGQPTDLDMLFTDNREEYRLARQMIEYHILRAAGAGVAALGGLDAIIVSGRFTQAGRVLGPWLREQLHLPGRPQLPAVRLEFYTETIGRIVADQALAAVRNTARRSVA
ncbi:MAG TPA: hypothetical protein VMZ31_13995 [Phycisphaerae bacterium]|nr:hypothetical protein [Phycisphaerae bacterium]